ncbi:hypothetical protein BJ170DRAFT_343524 [Xylariales sp. AK1849]|nr:hypothetical protein BJ170DRAFT_343524 [Xylariales sp. AK1849]
MNSHTTDNREMASKAARKAADDALWARARAVEAFWRKKKLEKVAAAYKARDAAKVSAGEKATPVTNTNVTVNKPAIPNSISNITKPSGIASDSTPCTAYLANDKANEAPATMQHVKNTSKHAATTTQHVDDTTNPASITQKDDTTSDVTITEATAASPQKLDPAAEPFIPVGMVITRFGLREAIVDTPMAPGQTSILTEVHLDMDEATRRAQREDMRRYNLQGLAASRHAH